MKNFSIFKFLYFICQSLFSLLLLITLFLFLFQKVNHYFYIDFYQNIIFVIQNSFMNNTGDQQQIIIDDRPNACLCFSFFKIFHRKDKKIPTKAPPQEKKQKLKIPNLQKCEQASFGKEAIINFPQVETTFISIELEQRDFVSQLCMDYSLIGIMGKDRIQFPQSTEIVKIGKAGEINNIKALRPFCFSHIFIMNGFEEHTVREIFSLQQTFSIKLKRMKEIQQLIQMWENFVKKNYGHISLKNILEKMFIKVTIIKDNFWLTLNEKVFEQTLIKEYNWESIGLKLKEDWPLIKNLNQYIDLSEFLEILRIKNEGHHKFSKNLIRDKLKKYMPEWLFLSSSQGILSKNSSQNSLQCSDEIKCSDDETQIVIMKEESNESNSDIYIVPQNKCEADQLLKPFKPLQRKHRSLSYGTNSQLNKLKFQNIEEELQKYS